MLKSGDSSVVQEMSKHEQQQQQKLEAKDVLPNINHTQAAERAKKCRFLSLVILTFDFQTRLSEVPNTSSV